MLPIQMGSIQKQTSRVLLSEHDPACGGTMFLTVAIDKITPMSSWLLLVLYAQSVNGCTLTVVGSHVNHLQDTRLNSNYNFLCVACRAALCCHAGLEARPAETGEGEHLS
jgi:hypothetical protein